MNWTMLCFAGTLSALTGVLFGLFPALQFWRLGIASRLRTASSRTATQGAGRSARKVLVVAEVAISLVLLIGAGLLIQTFKRLSMSILALMRAGCW